jgi:hypothetical protein
MEMQTSTEIEYLRLKSLGDEQTKMDTIKKCYLRAKVDEAPKFITGEFLLTPAHFDPESSLLRLNNSFLAAGAQILIKPICLCVLQRMQEKENPNHPYHILCYELLQWLTSNPESNEATLKNLRAREMSIIHMLSLLFLRKKREGELTATMHKEDESTFLLLASVKSTLIADIIPRLTREISDPISSHRKRSATPPPEQPQSVLAEPTATEPVIGKAMPVPQSPPTQRSPVPISAQPPKLPSLPRSAPAAATANNNPVSVVTDSPANTLAPKPRPLSPRLRHFLTQPIKQPQDKTSRETQLNISSEPVNIPAMTGQDPHIPGEPKATFNIL